VIEAVRAGRASRCIDGRDHQRLVDFFPHTQWHEFGFGLVDGDDLPALREWSEAEIIAQLRKDVAFGIEKAEGMRGISASTMVIVVEMWLWILDDDLESGDYNDYGLAFLREVGDKYGLER
jgi:hypothetical protein